ncbi:glycosyltransferase family 2 protein [Candidatus Parcubacteria bacterium]|nr:glycosyltransferase family 2 protein [Candidatus Parcubacteria bacterium]
MDFLQHIIVYFFLFVGIYFEVFILCAYLIHRKNIKADESRAFERTSDYPSVTIVVPVWNEEKTVGKTLESLFGLNYPKELLKITVVDDGSIDGTWNILQEYKTTYPHIEIYHKENGGKHTAVNYAIQRTTTDLIGCLDADSYVHPDTLKKLVCRFDDRAIMAVTPAIKIHNPKTYIQRIQTIEYAMGILFRKVIAIIGALHVTPGPFTIFRRTMFDEIGLFRHAHNTEDMEMAFRMQTHHLKIEDVHTAWVYTTGPNTVKKLYKQRVRWTYGFLRNVWDYKFLFLNARYGNIGLLTIPVAFTLIIGVVFSTTFFLFRISHFIQAKFIEWKTIGFHWPTIELNTFYLSAKQSILLTVFIFILMSTLAYNAQKLAKQPLHIRRTIMYFLTYPLISPFWILRSIYNVLLAKTTSWR